MDIKEKRYPIREAAQILGKSVKTTRKYEAEGVLASIRIGRHVFIPESSIEQLLEKGFKPAKVA